MSSAKRSDQQRTRFSYNVPTSVEIQVTLRCSDASSEAERGSRGTTLVADEFEDLVAGVVESIVEKRCQYRDARNAELIIDSDNPKMKASVMKTLRSRHTGLFITIR